MSNAPEPGAISNQLGLLVGEIPKFTLQTERRLGLPVTITGHIWLNIYQQEIST
jgi:hypothetical protein